MIRIRACLFVVAAAVLAAGCSVGNQERKYRGFFGQTAQTLAPGYSLAPESEYGPPWTSGDFNGDGKEDYAYILVANADGARALYAFLSAGEGYEASRMTDGFGEHMGLATRAPGTYATAAARGIGRDSPDNALAFEATHQAIDFFQSEGGASSFVWNEGTKSFDRYWTSD